MALNREEFLAGLRIPDLHFPRGVGSLGLIPSGTLGGQAFAVRAEDWLLASALDGEKFLAGLRIPHLNRIVIRSAGQAFAVRTEGHAAASALEGKEFLAGLGLPHCHHGGGCT